MGPGMCLIDSFSSYSWDKDYDCNAEFSKRGKINKELLAELMRHPFIHEKFPKSASIEQFNINFLLKILKNKKILNYDIIRTLVSFSSEAIAYNINKYIKFDTETNLLISGGGMYHTLLLQDIKNKIKLNEINLLERKNIHPDCKEAFLICTLAVANKTNVPANMKAVTGSRNDIILGEIYES